MGKPGFYFYTGDWLKDTRVLSAECRGCWIDSLCFLYENGGLVTWPVSVFARFWSVSEEKAIAVLDELQVTNVANVEWQNDGKTMANLSSRRILRGTMKRSEIAAVRVLAGKKGAQVRWQKCASSYSSSSSLNLNKNHKNDSSKIPLKRQPNKIPYPDGFEISEQLRTWCSDQHANPDEHLEAFRDFHTAKGSRFASWDAAFRTWVRNSFRFGGRTPQPQQEGQLSDRTRRILRRGLENEA